jgi:hypothetical protein
MAGLEGAWSGWHRPLSRSRQPAEGAGEQPEGLAGIAVEQIGAGSPHCTTQPKGHRGGACLPPDHQDPPACERKQGQQLSGVQRDPLHAHCTTAGRIDVTVAASRDDIRCRQIETQVIKHEDRQQQQGKLETGVCPRWSVNAGKFGAVSHVNQLLQW